MSSLSEQELLLLVNYEYFCCSTYSGTIGENISKLKNEDGSFDIKKVVAQGATGDIISEDDAIDILKRLDENKKLSNLHMARKVNEGGVRATLFANEDESDATLVFRGTGGSYKAWKDNVSGEYQADTRLQKVAADFVKYECAGFENITVTGHSKGGNLSQYVTIVSGDNISKCVSFDGQGFSKSFLKEYKNEIEASSDKITSISGYNDFVNILLTSVAGSVLYVKNQEGLSVDMHSCYTMLSNGVFDENGNFDRTEGVVSQMAAMKLVKWAGDGMTAIMDSLPNGGNEAVSGVLEAYVASIFSNDKGEKYEQDKIKSAIDGFKEYAGGLLNLTGQEDYSSSFHFSYLYMYKERVREVLLTFDEIYTDLVKYPEMVEDILVRLDFCIVGRSFTENALMKIIGKLDKNIEKIKRMMDALDETIKLYESADVLT